MRLSKYNLVSSQADKKIHDLQHLVQAVRPAEGWIYTIRKAINMSMRQLAERMHITTQSVKEMEVREKSGTITLDTLNKVAKALNMKLVYGFIPEAGSIDKMIEQRAEELATQIVMRTSASMKLEDQENSPQRITQAIKEMKEELKKEMPRYLWD